MYLLFSKCVTAVKVSNFDVYTVVCAPDDGWKYHLKLVEQFSDINKLCNVASCWIYEYIGILLGARPILHISRIKFNRTSSSYYFDMQTVHSLHIIIWVQKANKNAQTSVNLTQVLWPLTEIPPCHFILSFRVVISVGLVNLFYVTLPKQVN
jgi:hypothetical protein